MGPGCEPALRRRLHAVPAAAPACGAACSLSTAKPQPRAPFSLLAGTQPPSFLLRSGAGTGSCLKDASGDSFADGKPAPAPAALAPPQTVWPFLLGFPKDGVGVVDAVCMVRLRGLWFLLAIVTGQHWSGSSAVTACSKRSGICRLPTVPLAPSRPADTQRHSRPRAVGSRQPHTLQLRGSRQRSAIRSECAGRT